MRKIHRSRFGEPAVLDFENAASTERLHRAVHMRNFRASRRNALAILQPVCTFPPRQALAPTNDWATGLNRVPDPRMIHEA